MPNWLRLGFMSTVIAACGCASWHYRKESKKDRTSITGDDVGEVGRRVFEGLSYDSLHDWGAHSNRW
jgi:hypothetical protein